MADEPELEAPAVDDDELLDEPESEVLFDSPEPFESPDPEDSPELDDDSVEDDDETFSEDPDPLRASLR